MVKPVVISSKSGMVQKKLPKHNSSLNTSSSSLEQSILDKRTTSVKKRKKETLNDIHTEAVCFFSI